ncbi:MAG: hypothetical protein JRJ87_26085 [Deltaproteobacteria bacterium]|nr:hypothetical protein [Deltaproteobacteria bacterium]
MSDLEQTLRFFSNARVLRMLDHDGRQRLIGSAEPVTFNDGDTIMREGDPEMLCSSSSTGSPR